MALSMRTSWWICHCHVLIPEDNGLMILKVTTCHGIIAQSNRIWCIKADGWKAGFFLDAQNTADVSKTGGYPAPPKRVAHGQRSKDLFCWQNLLPLATCPSEPATGLAGLQELALGGGSSPTQDQFEEATPPGWEAWHHESGSLSTGMERMPPF